MTVESAEDPAVSVGLVDEIDPDGAPEGDALGESGELLWRQVPESWAPDGEPSSSAFRPTKKDRKRLSTARSSMISAEDAFERHKSRGLSSCGVWAVTAAEASQVECPAYHDGGQGGLDKDHVSLYFGGKSRGQAETASKILRLHALARGRQHL